MNYKEMDEERKAEVNLEGRKAELAQFLLSCGLKEKPEGNVYHLDECSLSFRVHLLETSILVQYDWRTEFGEYSIEGSEYHEWRISYCEEPQDIYDKIDKLFLTCLNNNQYFS